MNYHKWDYEGREWQTDENYHPTKQAIQEAIHKLNNGECVFPKDLYDLSNSLRNK